MNLPAPALDPAEKKLFDQGLEEFNTGFYFECHETLEDLWHGVRGPSRDFFQGLIQLSVAFYHLTRGNAGGAKSMLDRALGRLNKYPPDYAGVDLEGLRKEASSVRARLLGGEEIPAHESFPRCRRTG